MRLVSLCCFPNRSLWHTMGGYIATEARAFANQGQAGLTYFAPNINIYRYNTSQILALSEWLPGVNLVTTRTFVLLIFKT